MLTKEGIKNVQRQFNRIESELKKRLKLIRNIVALYKLPNGKCLDFGDDDIEVLDYVLYGDELFYQPEIAIDVMTNSIKEEWLYMTEEELKEDIATTIGRYIEFKYERLKKCVELMRIELASKEKELELWSEKMNGK